MPVRTAPESDPFGGDSFPVVLSSGKPFLSINRDGCAAGVTNGDIPVGLALAFGKVVREHLRYPGPILLKKADRSLARVGCQHLLSTGQPAACGSSGALPLSLIPFSITIYDMVTSASMWPRAP